MKKLLTLLLAAGMLAAALSGCGNKPSQSASGTDTSSQTSVSGASSSEAPPAQESDKNGPLFDEPVELNVLMPSMQSWPYQENWYIQNAIEEATNVKMNVQAILDSGAAFTEKLSLIVSSGQLPDLIFSASYTPVKSYWDQGAFANILDYSEDTPNFNAFKAANEATVRNYISPDGALYMFPEYGIDETNRRIFMYRKDVFDSLGLKAPTNETEFYDVCKALKEANPDSYPFAFRSNLGQFSMLAPSWGTFYHNVAFTNTYAYLNNDQTYSYGPIEDSFREMLVYYNKLYKEGLILPNVLSIDTKGWQDIISNNQGFITLDYISRIDFFNIPMKEANADFNLAYMPPPSFGTNGVAKLKASAEGQFGYIVGSTSKKIHEAVKFCDWFYTEEAKELVSWGKGDLYTEASDGRKWNEFATTADLRQKTGVSTYGMYLLFDFDSHISTFTDDVKKAYEQAYPFDMDSQPVLSLLPEEQEVMTSVGTAVQTYVDEQISKFILGEKSFDEWDAYVSEVKRLGVQQIVEISNKAFSR